MRDEPLFSLDGAPPSGQAHRLVAAAAVAAINEEDETADLPGN